MTRLNRFLVSRSARRRTAILLDTVFFWLVLGQNFFMMQNYRPRLYPQQKDSSGESSSWNRFPVFIIFLGIAVSAWFLLDFNPNQAMLLNYFLVVKTNRKDTRINLSDSSFNVWLSDSKTIRTWKSNMDLHTIVIDANELQAKEGKIDMSALLKERCGTNKPLHFTVRPAYISYRKTDLVSRKVKVDVSGSVRSDNAWECVSSPTAEPPEITIYGEPESIYAIRSVKLKPVDIIQKEGEQEQSTRIMLPRGVTSGQKQVTLSYEAGRYMNKEGIVSIDKNSYHNEEIRLLPAQVKINFRLPLKEINAFSLKNIVLGVDTTHLSQRKTLPVLVLQKPDYLKILKIEPDTLDFVLLKTP